MYRVELKVISITGSKQGVSVFLMYRVELKVSHLLYSLYIPSYVPNVPCGVESSSRSF